ncbi:MAG: YicC family protein [Chlorobi bacterium]|nr:YicC family protein [Chlorobiota bacterium]
MIRSMTGFGKSSRQFPDQRITVEIRTLNSKQQDISIRLPSAYREKELPLRKILGEKLIRGKIDCTLTIEDLTGATIPTVNTTAIKHYLNQMRDIAQDLDIRSEDAIIQAMLRWPEVLCDKGHEVSEDEWKHIVRVTTDAAEAVDRYRQDEGLSIEKDMRKQVETILSLLQEISPFEKERVTLIRERLERHIEEWKQITESEKERLEQEIFYYLEKLDITEEKIRLNHHCRYFLDTLNTEDAAGKKLGFISQEMGREINTLGSKSYHAGIQKIVIKMKDTLEKIKEQSLNVL